MKADPRRLSSLGLPSLSLPNPRLLGPDARQSTLLSRYRSVRAQSEALAAGLSAEDCMLQSMADASPVKWHLAHTGWFFETFVLEEAVADFRPFHPQFRVLFNSYYVGVGDRHARPERGLLSRPSLEEVFDYRHAVDDGMIELLSGQAMQSELLDTIELGLHHEEQHQELILTDLKHHFSRNPLQPAYRTESRKIVRSTTAPLVVGANPGWPATAADKLVGQPREYRYQRFEGGLVEIGHETGGFAFDNETPRHRVWLEPYALGERLVTNDEYRQFIGDGGYRRAELWLSDGWDACIAEGWQAPLYWLEDPASTFEHLFTLAGVRPIRPDEPVCHLSYYEADAYARWVGARLPTEFEWEAAANRSSDGGAKVGSVESGFHPQAARTQDEIGQLYSDVWQWTQSAYLPYPGYKPLAGAVGEYNGKFMINQMVLRGGSCATARDHTRASYRNFFPPKARWQFSGIRLARL